MAETVEVIVNDLGKELSALEGLHGQHPETGDGLGSGASYLQEYTNRVFGAPYQLLDSVDARFPSINKYLGNEYLKNFMLNSPILHIKPGLPKYTGGTDANAISTGIKNIYMNSTQGGMSTASALINQLAKSTVFGGGSKLQKRMFGFRECYYDYMQHVNYMCRSMATFLSLTESGKGFPTGTFAAGSNKIQEFSNFKWQNYRMMANTKVLSPWEYLKQLGDSTAIGAVANTLGSGLNGFLSIINPFNGNNLNDLLGEAANSISDAWEFASNTAMSDVMANKISTVEFMVEPIQFSESLANTSEPSLIESTIDAIGASVGSELAWITNSNVDFGMLEGATEVLGDTLDSAVGMLNGLTQNTAGGFVSNLFSGAINSIKGQKMIYPEIYKTSASHMDYQFSITLTSPYGDIYNYYMNIVVPLMHLIALASPRMVTSNTVTSPYLVQAYIPGMCTCQLGIIESMNITKNPSTKHVSVNGFPLTIKVEFTIKELYNAMSISPANDPASFLFNETLNDYMSNLAGLSPSIDTYTKQRKNAFKNMGDYINSGDWANDIANKFVTKVEDMYNPFV